MWKFTFFHLFWSHMLQKGCSSTLDCTRHSSHFNNSPVHHQEWSLSPVLLRSPAPLSGRTPPQESPPFQFVLSVAVAVWVEQLCVGTHSVCSLAEWWHRTVAFSSTEGPFVSQRTQVSYSQHNGSIHSFSLARDKPAQLFLVQFDKKRKI